MATAAKDKKQETVAQYVSDMLALEGHIAQALEAQVSGSADHPEIQKAIQGFLATTKRHVARLDQYMETFGDEKGFLDKTKQGVGSIFGVAAGAIDKVRTHPLSKDMRDDYTAASLAIISYQMLRTTALACGDTTTAAFAQSQQAETIAMAQWIARTIPEIVVSELAKENDLTLTPGAAQQVTGDAKMKNIYGVTI